MKWKIKYRKLSFYTLCPKYVITDENRYRLNYYVIALLFIKTPIFPHLTILKFSNFEPRIILKVFLNTKGVFTGYYISYSYFIFDLFREGSPSTEVVFQGALQ